MTWHDGAPFTSADLMFSFELAMDASVPKPALSAISQMDSAEAPDDFTFVVYWSGPTTRPTRSACAPSGGPRHLEQPYRTLDRQAFANRPYWTSEFVHLGPFKLEEFAGESAVLAAYDRYFLGKPKVDHIIMRIFGDPNALYAATLAGTVDILLEARSAAAAGSTWWTIGTAPATARSSSSADPPASSHPSSMPACSTTWRCSIPGCGPRSSMPSIAPLCRRSFSAATASWWRARCCRPATACTRR